MNARRLLSVFALVWIGFGPRGFAATSSSYPVAPPLNPAIAELMDQLASDDPHQREDATARLGNYGDLIRPALLEATKHADLPEVRSRAARLLCILDWSRPEDSPAVQQALAGYRTTEPEGRLSALQRLAEVDDGSAFEALLRLLAEEPSEDVRWGIVELLRRVTDVSRRRRLREITAMPNDAPALAAEAWAWQSVDGAKFAARLRQAIDVYEQHPSDDQGEINFALRTLEVRAINAGDCNGAAELKRRQIRFSQDPLPLPLLDLFAMHAQYGPLKGFERDLHVYDEYFSQPELMYILGRLHARHGHPLLASACFRSAAAASLASQESHKRVADFLMGRGWYELAQGEYRMVLASPGAAGNEGHEKEALDADAIVGLARSASGMGNEAEAVDQLKRFLDFAAHIPGREIRNREEYEAELAWHALRAARDANDWTDAARHIDRLLSIHLGNPEAIIDAVIALKKLNRTDEAAHLFNQSFSGAKSQLAGDPHNPEYLNNLAWLCARCDEHVEEAAKWSAEAVSLAPGNAAYLDTAAEACSHVGRWEEAVQLETSALRLQPGDRFMTAQVARFKEGLAKAGKS